MEFLLLGSVEVQVSDTSVRLAATKPRALLAAGLLGAGRVVSVEHLIDAIWTDPPVTASALIQSYVSALRRALADAGAPDVIATRSPGYVFQVEPGHLDVHRFESLLAAGRAAETRGDHRATAELLRSALALWRGPALDGLDSPSLRAAATRLDELRLVALEERIAVDLRLGRETQLVAEIRELVATHPLREQFRCQLMLALYRLGRQAEALAVYRDGARELSTELGLDPGPELSRIHGSILRADPALLHDGARREPVVIAAAPRGTLPPPAQLPAAAVGLTGRNTEIVTVRQALVGENPVPVCTISGKAGSGKTALAVYVAQLLRGEFPDGQLYANLRGSRGGPATQPGDVLAGFLRALGTTAAHIPDSTDERASLFRSLLVDRRVLVLLDDARAETQLRPLLPGQPGCAVLTTSRPSLCGLEGAVHLGLDVLEPASAADLLTRIVGPARVLAEPGAAADITKLCGYLPLAVQTAGARLSARPQWRLSLLAARLGDEQRRLDELAVGDLEVRASLALSYQGLDDTHRRAFRLLGLLGPSDFAPWVVAPLLDTTIPDAERMVERLADMQLLDFAGNDQHGQPRYRLHDLIRIYASERAEVEESQAEQRHAVERVLQCWTGLLDVFAARLPSGNVSSSRAGTAHDRWVTWLVERLPADPTSWFAAEQATLVAAVESGSQLGLDELSCELAATLASSSFRLHNQFEEWWRTHDVALAAARRAGNRRGEATLLAGLGHLRYEQDRCAEARTYFQAALDIFQAIGDLGGEATALAGLGAVCHGQGHLAEALSYLRRGLNGFDVLGDQRGIANTAYDVGAALRDAGQFDDALATFDTALVAYRVTGDRRGEALTLRGTGLVHRAAGRLSRAGELCGEAIDILRDTGDRLALAYAVQALAKVHIRQRADTQAETELGECLEVCRELDDTFGCALMLRTLGELHLAAGSLEEAESHLYAALSRWDDLAMPLFRARTLRDVATLHERRGDHAHAGVVREEAIAIFREYGSRECAELTASRLPPAASRPAPASLQPAGSEGRSAAEKLQRRRRT